MIYMYSGTPPSGHPWNAAIYDNVDTLLGPEYYLHRLTYNQNPWNADTSLFRKADTWPQPYHRPYKLTLMVDTLTKNL